MYSAEEVRGMLNDRKKALINWANNRARADGVFLPSLRLQKFLFFYECFSKVEGDEYSFENLKGYKRGPVFEDVYREIKQNEGNLYISKYTVNDERAVKALFLVLTLGNELSEFTHHLDIWKTHEKTIIEDDLQVPLHDSDFSAHDTKVFKDIIYANSRQYIEQHKIIEVGGKSFVAPKEMEIRENHYDAFYLAAIDPDFRNPVYVSIIDGDLCLE